MSRYVTIRKCSEETGHSEDAIRQKIARQDWERGKIYTKAPDGRVLIDMDGYQNGYRKARNYQQNSVKYHDHVPIPGAKVS